MNIQTGFNCGDEIWFIHEAKALSSIVRGFKITVDPQTEELAIICLCSKEKDVRVHLKVDASKAYPTKAELLKSL